MRAQTNRFAYFLGTCFLYVAPCNMFLQGGDCFKKLTGLLCSCLAVYQGQRDIELHCLWHQSWLCPKILRKYVANAKRDTFSSETLASNRRVVDVAVAFA